MPFSLTSLIAPAIGLAGDLIGGSSSAKSSQRMAREQMAFQERMANTSYQRAVKDLTSAGLNPSLAYSQGGAAVPSGAKGEAPDMSQLGSRAVGNYATAAQVQNIKASTAKTEAETLLTQEKWQEALMKNKYEANKYGKYVGQPGEGAGAFEADMEKLRSEASAARENADVRRTDAAIRKIEERVLEAISGSTISTARSSAEIREKEVTYQELQNTLARLKLPEAEAMAKWFDAVGAGSPAAKATMAAGQWLKLIFGK